MNPSPEIFMRGASIDWEALLPIIFFVLYGLAQFIGTRKKTSEQAEEEGEDKSDAAEKARKIREEIQRKIRERAKAVREQPSGGDTYQPSYDPNIPDTQQPRPVYRPAQPPAEEKREESRQRPDVKKAEPVASSSASTDIEKRLREQRKRLEAARERQKEARAEAQRIMKKAWDKGGTSSKPRLETASGTPLLDKDSFRRQVITGLREPNSLRKAVLYREILDPPVGMR